MKLRLFSTALATCMLMACAPVNELLGGASPESPEARCRAAGAESVLGAQADARGVNEAIRGSGALRSRVIQPGGATTMELDPLRINLEVDASNRVRRLRCG